MYISWKLQEYLLFGKYIIPWKIQEYLLLGMYILSWKLLGYSLLGMYKIEGLRIRVVQRIQLTAKISVEKKKKHTWKW